MVFAAAQARGFAPEPTCCRSTAAGSFLATRRRTRVQIGWGIAGSRRVCSKYPLRLHPVSSRARGPRQPQRHQLHAATRRGALQERRHSLSRHGHCLAVGRCRTEMLWPLLITKPVDTDRSSPTTGWGKNEGQYVGYREKEYKPARSPRELTWPHRRAAVFY